MSLFLYGSITESSFSLCSNFFESLKGQAIGVYPASGWTPNDRKAPQNMATADARLIAAPAGYFFSSAFFASSAFLTSSAIFRCHSFSGGGAQPSAHARLYVPTRLRVIPS